MPKESSNDALVRYVREHRAALVKQLSRQAAEKISKQLESKKKPTVDQIAEIIAAEFAQLPA